MNIALMSHDNRKDLMVQFCTAYAGILSRHSLYATNTTGHMVAEATGLKVEITYISRLCDQNNVPFASNIATAEMLVLGLARGDLDWRMIVNPTSNRPIA